MTVFKVDIIVRPTTTLLWSMELIYFIVCYNFNVKSTFIYQLYFLKKPLMRWVLTIVVNVATSLYFCR